MRKRGKGGGLVVTSLLLFAAYHFSLTGLPLAKSAPAPSSRSVVAKMIAFAESREGCPYVWGGTGPCSAGYDCSGLVMEAFLAAGGTTFGSSRPTAAVEWDYGPQVSSPRRGDLVFFSGADGTPQAPGHVGIVLGPNELIDAYASGTVVRVESFGLASSASGLQYPVGYTDPG